MAVPPQPYVDITTGDVYGTLVHGQPFYWYNPTNTPAIVSNCGNFCAVGAYEVPPNGSTIATILTSPNQNGNAFSSTQFGAPGMPHLQSPITFPARKDEAA